MPVDDECCTDDIEMNNYEGDIFDSNPDNPSEEEKEEVDPINMEEVKV